MTRNETPTLLFVYNADSGVFNALSDMAHKLFSPRTYSCNLCKLTHSTFSMRDEWKAFLEGLGAELEFLHRDEFRARFPERQDELPAVFRRDGRVLEVVAEAGAVNACSSMDELKQLIAGRAAA